MIKIITVAVIFVMVLSGNASSGWYSRARLDKWVADSLKRIDTLRIADSVRKADSLTVMRYQQSDILVVKEKQREAEERKNAPVMPDTEVIPIPGMVDNTSGRTIVIDPKNPFAKTIDSLQKVIDSINTRVHDNDSRFKEMKSFPISEKTRYMVFLLKNKLKDTTSIVAYCNTLFEMYKTKHDLLLAIKNSQDPNTKNFIQHHIEEHKQKMSVLSNFILAMTPKVPFLPQREQRKKITGQ
jgi:hypothetical protein